MRHRCDVLCLLRGGRALRRVLVLRKTSLLVAVDLLFDLSWLLQETGLRFDGHRFLVTEASHMPMHRIGRVLRLVGGYRHVVVAVLLIGGQDIGMQYRGFE